jgi:hypothetical protein
MPDLASTYRDAGFSDAEITDHLTGLRTTYQAAGFTDAEIDAHMGIPATPEGVPQSVVQRVMSGSMLSQAISKLPKAITDIPSEAISNTVDTFKDAVANLLPKEFGGAREPQKEGAAEGISRTGLGLVDMAALPFAPLVGAVHAFAGHPIVAAAGVMRDAAVRMYGEDRVRQAERAEGLTPGGVTFEDAKKITDTAMMALGSRSVMRVGMGPMGTPEITEIGGLPKGQDFSNAATAIGNGDAMPKVEAKLAELYQDKGVHPAEVAHDAQADPTIAQSILSSDRGDMPAAYGPPIVQFRMEAAAIEQSLPPVEDGLARLWRGNRSGEVGTATQFTNDLPGIALPFRKSYGGQLSYVDISEADLSKYEQKAGAATGAEFNLPQEIASQAKAVGGGIGNLPPEPPGGGPGRPPSYGDAEKQILSKISIDEKAPERALTWDGLYTGFIDKLFPIAKAVKEADLPDLTAENNPYQLARLMAGYAGKADHFLNNGTFDFATYENNGPSLKSILRPVAKDLNGFRAYATASRALELEGRGVESGFNFPEQPSAPPLVSSGLDAARTVVAEGRDKYEKPFRDLVDYQNRVGAYLRDSGVLSANGYKAMVDANKMYVPFSRVMGLDEGAPAVGGSSLQAHNPIKAIKGSARDIVDPVESVVRNTFHMVEMAERNVVGTKLVDMLQGGAKAFPESPAAITAERLPELPRAGAIADTLAESGVRRPEELAQALAQASEPEREGQISILRDGKRETYSVDPELARAMKGLDAQSMSMLERALAFPASTLRAGAVSTPEFWGRHVLRDLLYAMTTFKEGVFSPIDMGKGFAGLIMKDEDYWNWLKGGGGNISSVGIDRRYLQEDLRKLTGQTGLAGRAWNVLADPEASMWDKAGALGKLPFQAIGKFVLDPLRAATQFAENASHLAAFKKSMRAADRAEPEATNLRDKAIRAAWVSRDTAVDAARMGANMRAYNLITAFANIKLQDSDRVVRAIRDNPISSLVKIGAAVTVPSVALWAANHDDPRYAEIPQWQKDMFWLVMTPDHVFRIPKPWAMGMVFGTLPERLLDQYVGEKPDAFKDFFKQFWTQVGPEFVPTAAAPIVDQFANRSTFTNRTLIPSAQEKFLPEYQYTPYTTELTKAVGRIVGAFPGISDVKMDQSASGGIARAITSPILMENYIRGWTGTLGNYALTAADTALRKQGILPDPPQPTATLADIPIIRAFVVRYPSTSAQSIQDFYDNYERNKSYFTTFMAKARDGDVVATQHIVDMGGPSMFMRLDSVAQTLNEHSKLVQDIYKNPEVPPAEKRQLIDQLYYSMIQVARSGNDVIRTMQGQIIQKNMLPQ